MSLVVVGRWEGSVFDCERVEIVEKVDKTKRRSEY
jgi:hypothetical protein